MSTTILEDLVSVRYYTPSDVYHYTTDNRPLTDLTTNVTTIASLLSNVQAVTTLSNPGSAETVGGLVVMWGTGSCSTPSGGTFTEDFPTPFPNECLGIQVVDRALTCVPYGAAVVSSAQYQIFIPGASVQAGESTLTTTPPVTWSWLAWGY